MLLATKPEELVAFLVELPNLLGIWSFPANNVPILVMDILAVGKENIRSANIPLSQLCVFISFLL